MKRIYCLVALSLTALGCEAATPDLDAALGAAQPGSPDAGAPPVTQPVDAGLVAPLDAGSLAHDAGATVDSGATSMDSAAAPGAGDASADANSSASDAQADTGAVASNDGGFPPVSDVSVKGPYTSKTINSSGPGGAYTIFHPAELAPNGVLSPIVSWGNGGFTTPVDYPQLPHLASHGFVVIAANDSLVTGAQVRAGVDWIVQQNEVSTSPFYKKLDVKRIAGVGYSNGGLATLEAADDPRYLTIVIISGANLNEDSRATNMSKLHTPIAYLCTDDDASKGNCMADFAVVKQPAFFGVMKGTAHTDVTTILGLGVDAAIKRVATGTTAWLRWQVLGDLSFKPTFVGADCTLCKDSAWTVQQKGLQ